MQYFVMLDLLIRGGLRHLLNSTRRIRRTCKECATLHCDYIAIGFFYGWYNYPIEEMYVRILCACEMQKHTPRVHSICVPYRTWSPSWPKLAGNPWSPRGNHPVVSKYGIGDNCIRFQFSWCYQPVGFRLHVVIQSHTATFTELKYDSYWGRQIRDKCYYFRSSWLFW